MAANNTLSVTSLDYVGITDDLVSFLRNYPQFKDYDFEGSNLRTLIDVLGYNTYLNSFYTNMAINEMFLDTAVLRDSIISHAKHLNYLPRSARSSEAKIDITVYPTDAPAYIKVAKGTGFQGTNGNSVFTFTLDSDLIITGESNNYIANSVSIFEGINVTEKFVVNTAIENQRFILSNPNIDTTSLIVQVTNSTSTSETWSYSETLLGLNNTSKVYFLQAVSDKYELIFGDNSVGKSPPNGGVITASYRISSLDSPNGINNFRASSSIGGYSNFVISPSLDSLGNIISSSGGLAPESLSSIKYYAPRTYQTLDRAVTAEDYKNILYTKFPEIRAIHVYGGDELDPPQYGKVFIVVDVLNADGLSQIETDKISSFIDTKSPTSIHPVVVSADYTYAAITSNITYDLNVSSLSQYDIQTKVLNSITEYNQNNLDNFNVTLRYSKLVSAIDSSDSSINGSETSVQIFKKINPDINVDYSVSLDYQNKIVAKSISSTGFVYKGSPAKFIDNGKGIFQLAVTISGSLRSVVNIGTVDYDNGIINITNLNVDSFSGNAIRIFANTSLFDFSSKKNTILTIDPANVKINVTGIRT